MKEKNIFGHAISVPLLKHIQPPENDEERQQCLAVALILQHLSLKRADLLLMAQATEPIIRLQYQQAPRPAAWWSKYLTLYAQLPRGQSWLGRMSHFLPATRELWFMPRPDNLNPGLAKDAVEQNSEQLKLALITLRVTYSPERSSRTFVLQH